MNVERLQKEIKRIDEQIFEVIRDIAATQKSIKRCRKNNAIQNIFILNVRLREEMGKLDFLREKNIIANQALDKDLGNVDAVRFLKNIRTE